MSQWPENQQLPAQQLPQQRADPVAQPQSHSAQPQQQLSFLGVITHLRLR
jgi:hypothetical protein